MSARTPAIPASFHGPTILPIHYHQHNVKQQRKWLSSILLSLVMILLLYLLASTIVLTVKVTKQRTNPQNPLLDFCVNNFAINAPVNPSAYPCSTCLPIVLSANDRTDASINIKQFCALTAIHSLVVNASGLTSWMSDLRVCTWAGVECDIGRVTALSLSPPGIPTSIPPAIHALESLRNLEILGDTQSPAGTFPLPLPDHSGLPLQTLDLQATKLSSISARMISNSSLKTLSLISNENMDGNDTFMFVQNLAQTNVVLDSIIINRQPLATNPLSVIANSPMASNLVLIDLTTTSLPNITAPFSPSAFTSLKELHLDGNAFLPNQLPDFGPSVTVTV